MRILGAIVEMAAHFLAPFVSDRFHGRAIRRASVSHYDFGISEAFHCRSEEFQRRSLVALLCDIGFQNFAFMIHRALRVARFAAYLHKDLVQVPAPLRHLAHRFRSPLTDHIGKVSSEAIDPKTNTFVANIDASLVEQVFDIPQ